MCEEVSTVVSAESRKDRQQLATLLKGIPLKSQSEDMPGRNGLKRG